LPPLLISQTEDGSELLCAGKEEQERNNPRKIAIVPAKMEFFFIKHALVKTYQEYSDFLSY
jgi:hypothetical protein